MMRRSHLQMLSIVLGLLILGGCQAGTPAATVTAIPPTATLALVPSIIPLPTATPSPTPQSVPGGCDIGFMVINTDKGLNLVCTDGSFSQRIVSTTEMFSDGNCTINDIAASSDGRYLAFDVEGSCLEDKSIYVIDLSDYTTKTVYSFKLPHLNIQLSPNGEYIGYVIGREEDISSQIEFVHLASNTISQAITPEMIVPGGNANVGFNDFDWSPDGNQISYIAWDDRTPQYMSHTGYIADVACDPQTHMCKASDPRILPEIRSQCNMAWSFHDSNIVVKCIVESGEELTEIRTSKYGLVQQLALDGFYGVSLSPSGKHLAMYSTMERKLYILKLDDMTKFLLADSDHGYTGPFVWLP